MWDLERKERLVDSVFAGLMLPAVYLREMAISHTVRTSEHLECVDGKQRISALAEFMDAGFAYSGLLFRQLDIGTRRRFGMTIVPTIVVKNLSDEQTEELYDRINFSGVPHKPEDRRKKATK